MKKAENLLDYIPKRNENFQWELNEENLAVVIITRTGFYNKIAQRFFKVPKSSRIQLDIYGTFVWQLMDGRHTVEMIAAEIEKKFDKDAQPLYNRLITFIKILKANKFITIQRKEC